MGYKVLIPREISDEWVGVSDEVVSLLGIRNVPLFPKKAMILNNALTFMEWAEAEIRSERVIGLIDDSKSNHESIPSVREYDLGRAGNVEVTLNISPDAKEMLEKLSTTIGISEQSIFINALTRFFWAVKGVQSQKVVASIGSNGKYTELVLPLLAVFAASKKNS